MRYLFRLDDLFSKSASSSDNGFGCVFSREQ